MSEQMWMLVVINSVTVLVQLGVFLQQHREYNRRIQALEDDKLDKSVHDEVVRRIDGNLADMNRYIHSKQRS